MGLSLSKASLHGGKQRPVKKGLMLALVDLPLKGDLANVKPVLQNVGERSDHEALGGDHLPVGEKARPWLDALLLEVGGEFAN